MNLKGVALDNYQKASIDKSSEFKLVRSLHNCAGRQIDTYSSQANDLDNSVASVAIPDLSVLLPCIMLQKFHLAVCYNTLLLAQSLCP